MLRNRNQRVTFCRSGTEIVINYVRFRNRNEMESQKLTLLRHRSGAGYVCFPQLSALGWHICNWRIFSSYRCSIYSLVVYHVLYVCVNPFTSKLLIWNKSHLLVIVRLNLLFSKWNLIILLGKTMLLVNVSRNLLLLYQVIDRLGSLRYHLLSKPFSKMNNFLVHFLINDTHSLGYTYIFTIVDDIEKLLLLSLLFRLHRQFPVVHSNLTLRFLLFLSFYLTGTFSSCGHRIV